MTTIHAPHFWTWLVSLGLLTFDASAGEVFNVRDFGARGDRATNDRSAIQAAIDACAKAGGGVVQLPPGDYFSGALRLSSGVELQIESGATLWASTNRQDYAGISDRHFLSAEGARDVAITGRGTINGQATADYGSRWGVPDRPAFRTGILLFTDCTNTTVRGVTIRNSDAWTLHFKRCENVVVEGVTIRNNYRRLNSDGIDPNMCRKVRIAGCNIVAGDDCIVLKATESHPCEDVVVTDCFLESAASAIKLGTESHGDFRNISFANCVVSNSPTGIGFYLKDGGTMENVVFSNIVIGPCYATFRDVTPVFMDIEKRTENSKIGRIRNVRFERLDITGGSGVLVQGMAESPIEKLAFSDVRFRVPQAADYAKRKKPIGGRRETSGPNDTAFARLPSYFAVAHARELRVENLSVEIAEAASRQFARSAFCGRYLEDVALINVRRQPGEAVGGAPIIDLRDCRGVNQQPGK